MGRRTIGFGLAVLSGGVAATLVLLPHGLAGCASRKSVALPRASSVTMPAPQRPLECPPDMVRADSFCIDRYEAYVVELGEGEREKPHSPFLPVAGLRVRAKNEAGVVPQAYISRIEAADACANAGKRLCTGDEFVFACSGGKPEDNDYPYGGHERQAGVCNEGKGSTMVRFFGDDPKLWTQDDLNDPRLNEWDGGLARTGSFPQCVSGFGLYDCVGNLHEWVDEADPRGRGRFRGGFYGDAENHGPGCKYMTHGHMPSYHDYSTGFRCCTNPQ